jgi:hypothetical protein
MPFSDSTRIALFDLTGLKSFGEVPRTLVVNDPLL